jgi:lipopolysaccharide/colanic/teichoic acid biosynthesis glycosyltransferase
VIKLDLEYINTWSVAGDIAIILKTVKVLFTGDGAK